jgi:hypothetical protein
VESVGSGAFGGFCILELKETSSSDDPSDLHSKF